MLSAYDIDNFKDNFTWFMENLKKYNFIEENNPFSIYNYIMFLEVRNNDWTNEKLFKYIDCLNYMIEYDIKNIWEQEPTGLEYLVSRLSKIHYSNPLGNKYSNYVTYLSDD